MKIKRFAVLIPLVFILILSIVPLGSSFAASNAAAYNLSEWGLVPSEDSYSYLIQSYIATRISSSFNCNVGTDYFYAICKHPNDYNSESPLVYPFRVFYFDISNTEPLWENDFYICYECDSWFYFNMKQDGTISNKASGVRTDGSMRLVYDKTYGQVGHYSTSDNLSNFENAQSYSDIIDHKYIYYQETNVEGFPLVDPWGSSSNGMNVSVSFSPDLRGIVNTSVIENGVTTQSNYFNMHITNNSSFGIQYFMAIVDHEHTVFTGSQGVYNDYGDSVHYVFSTDEWVNRVTEYDMEGNSSVAPARRRSEWHYLGSSATNIRNFSWSQMQLYKNKYYDVVVYAYPLADYDGCVSTMHEYPLFDWSSCQEVYRSAFFMPYDTTYNPDDMSFGNYPNKSGDTMNHGLYSAYVDENGNTQYAPNGSYFSNDDLDNNRTSASYVYTGSSSSSGSSVSSDFNNLSSNFSSFFQFLNRVFSFFPRSYQSVITCGLTAVIVLGVLKVVIK